MTDHLDVVDFHGVKIGPLRVVEPLDGLTREVMPTYANRCLPRRLTRDELRAVQASILAEAKRRMRLVGKAHAHMYLYHSVPAYGEITFNANEFMRSDREKDRLAFLIKGLAKNMGIYATILFSEVWYGHGDDGPRDKEGIMTVLETKSESRLLMADTIRGHSGKVRTFRDMPMDNSRKTGPARFQDWLQP